jgi:hypothetical protein
MRHQPVSSSRDLNDAAGAISNSPRRGPAAQRPSQTRKCLTTERDRIKGAASLPRHRMVSGTNARAAERNCDQMFLLEF